MIFICTHNSRRSHFSQLWAHTAATYYGLKNVAFFSGGTEATACNPRTVQALRRAGFSVVQTTEGGNPVYLAQISDKEMPLKLYSKVFATKENPQKDFLAGLTCRDAADSCPIVNAPLCDCHRCIKTRKSQTIRRRKKPFTTNVAVKLRGKCFT